MKRTSFLPWHSLSIMFFSLILSATVLYAETPQGTLPGTVRDSRTKSSLFKASVRIVESTQEAETDSAGNFQFTGITPGLYSLQVSASKYDTLLIPNVHVKSGTNTLQVIDLKKSTAMHELSKVRVVASRLDHKKAAQTNSMVQVSNFELSNIAGTANDVNRVLGMLPSTVFGLGPDFDNNILVRGGHSSENIFLVDGIELENINHFSSIDESGGQVGFINSTFIRNLDFYAGGIPASMPSRLSSVTDIYLRDGSLKDYKYQIDLNMSGLGLTGEGPLPGKTGSFLVTGRIAYLRFLEPFMDNIKGIPFFGDAQVKTTLNPTKNDKVSFLALFAFDDYNEDSEDWFKEDTSFFPTPSGYHENLFQYAGGLSWEHLFKDARNKVHLSATKRDESQYEDLSLYTSQPDLTDHYAQKRVWEESDSRESATLKNDFSLFLRENDQFDLGLYGTYNHYSMKNLQSRQETGFYFFPVDTAKIDTQWYEIKPFKRDSSEEGYQVGGYAQYVFVQNRLKANVGLRGDYYSLFRNHAFSPRFAMSYNTGRPGTFSLSTGLYYQQPARLNDIFFEFLVPNSNWDQPNLHLYEIDLQRNLQTVLGYEKYFKNTYYFTAEVYYKWYDREYTMIDPERTDIVDTIISSGTQEWYRLNKPRGKKRVYGLELLFQKKKYDAFYYAFAYSLFNAENKYKNGNWYTDGNAVRNVLSATVGTNILKHHGFSLRLNAMEGKPTTDQYLSTNANGYSYPVYDTTSDYFSKRFDPHISLHFRYTFKLYGKRTNFTGYVEVINLLNNTPVIDRYFNGWDFTEQKVNGIVPIAGLKLDF